MCNIFFSNSNYIISAHDSKRFSVSDVKAFEVKIRITVFISNYTTSMHCSAGNNDDDINYKQSINKKII